MNKENTKNTKDFYKEIENASDLQPTLMFLMKLIFDRKGVAGIKESIEESSKKAQEQGDTPLIDVMLSKLTTYSSFLDYYQSVMSKEQKIEMTELIAEALIDVKVYIQSN